MKKLYFIMTITILVVPMLFNFSIAADEQDSLRGIVVAPHRAKISSGLSARIRTIPFQKGAKFNKGDLLISFNCDAQKAEAEAMHFGYVALQRKYENAQELFANGAAGSLDVAISAAEKDKAGAEVRAIKARLAECRIKAPYNGYIVERHVAAHETPPLNAPLLTIIDADALEIHFILPSRQLKSIALNQQFKFLADDTTTAHTAKLIRTGAVIDPVSQTIEMIAIFTGDEPHPLPGMSGIALFPKTTAAIDNQG